MTSKQAGVLRELIIAVRLSQELISALKPLFRIINEPLAAKTDSILGSMDRVLAEADAVIMEIDETAFRAQERELGIEE